MSAVSLAELASVVSLGVTGISTIGFGLAFADADLGYFDPRPAVRRARPFIWDVTRSDSLYPLLQRWDNARYSVRNSTRNAVLDAAALVLLLTTTPKGALR